MTDLPRKIRREHRSMVVFRYVSTDIEEQVGSHRFELALDEDTVALSEDPAKNRFFTALVTDGFLEDFKR